MTTTSIHSQGALRQLKSNIRSLTADISIYERRIDSHNSCVADFEKRQNRLELAAKELNDVRTAGIEITALMAFASGVGMGDPWDSFEAKIQAGINARIQDIKTAISYRAEYENIITDKTIALADARQKLAREELREIAAKVIDHELLISQLENINVVKHAEVNDSEFFVEISCKLDGIVMSPAPGTERTAWSYLSDYNNTRSSQIPLKPIVLKLLVVKSEYTETFISAHTDFNIKGYDNRYLPHPHWISVNHPCLGDFGGGITEALNDCDYALVFMLYTMYLAYYNPEDGAGKYFINWVKSNERPNMQSRQNTMNNFQGRLGEFISDHTSINSIEALLDPRTKHLFIPVVFDTPPRTVFVQNDYDDNNCDYDDDGYDDDGYNADGYDLNGYNRDGYDDNGYNEDGYNEDGYNEDGYNEDGYNEDGHDCGGYDENGYNENGYNREGFDYNGYDFEGYNAEGYNADGYNREGYNRVGYNQDGYDENGYDFEGYDSEGYNAEGYDSEGYNRYGDAL